MKKVGDTPSKEEFCFYVRAHKWAKKMACAAKTEAEALIESGTIHEQDIMMHLVKKYVTGDGPLPTNRRSYCTNFVLIGN